MHRRGHGRLVCYRACHSTCSRKGTALADHAPQQKEMVGLMTTSGPLKTGDKPKRLKRTLGNLHPAILIIGGNAIILAGAALMNYRGAGFSNWLLHHSGWVGDWLSNRGPEHTHGYHPDSNSPDGVHHLGKDVHHLR